MIFQSPIPRGSDPAAREARGAAREAQAEVEALRFEVERLLLITEALWRVAKEKLDRGDDELIRRITEIDLEDGRFDGRKAPTPPRPCPHCQRILTKHRPRCLYCGKPVEMAPFER
jgi:hypothetical protein